MPDPSTEIEELRRRVEEQSQRIDELQDALHTLAIAVQYRQEEPYLAFLAEHGIAGRRRVALNGVIMGCCPGRGVMLPPWAKAPALSCWRTFPRWPRPTCPNRSTVTRLSASSARSWEVSASARRRSKPTAPAAWGAKAIRHSPADQTPTATTRRPRCSRHPRCSTSTHSPAPSLRRTSPAESSRHVRRPSRAADHPFRALTRRDAGPACPRRQTGPATTSCHNVATRPKTATSPAS